MTRPTTGPEKPPAFKHGLTSRWAWEARAEDVEALAELLAASSPRVTPITTAARDAAEAILEVSQARRMRVHVQQELTRNKPNPLEEAAHSTGGDVYQLLYADMRVTLERMRALRRPSYRVRPQDAAANALLEFLAEGGRLLDRLDDYERRALSRRSKALRRLDHARIDVERARAAGRPA